MTDREINLIVAENFRDVVCPHCEEVVPIRIRNVDLPNEFKEETPGALSECKEFMNVLNGLVQRVRSGELSLKNLSLLLAQYRQ